MSRTTFVASHGAAYERFMGRWTERLAEPFLAFAKIGPETLSGGHLLDVGCGTGRLTFVRRPDARHSLPSLSEWTCPRAF